MTQEIVWPLGVTPYGLCVALSALAALLMLMARRKCARRGSVLGISGEVDALEMAVVCIPCAFVGARLFYCLARFEFFFFELGPLSVFYVRQGGFLLYGAVCGALLGAAVLAIHRGVSLPHTLDELAVPGLLMIAVCRLAEGTTGEGVGAWVESEALCRFPFAVQNEYGEWQLAVFLAEALAAALILIALWRAASAPGEKILTALLLYACCQVVFESLRMDSCPRIGFVRISQVLSAVAILVVTLVRALRSGGAGLAAVRGALVLIGCAAVGGIEWALDKTPVDNRLLYAGMTLVCVGLAVNGLRFARREE